MYHQPQLLHHGESQGDLCLRQALCRYLHQFRGVQCRPEQVLIGAGMEYLLMVLCCLLPESTLYAVEEPGYRKAWQAIENSGRRVVHIPLDAGGLSAAQLAQSGATCAYLTPSHQFPTGIVMPAGRRAELLRWAAQQPGRYLVEDDYDSEFRYRGKPIPSLQSSDEKGKVIYIGTFSKAIAPAIRVSYMVLPGDLLDIYRRDCSFYSCTVSRIDQRILNEFIRDGYFERHLNKMRMRYRAKHDLLLAGLEPFKKQFVISGEDAGLHLLLTAKGNVTIRFSG